MEQNLFMGYGSKTTEQLTEKSEKISQEKGFFDTLGRTEKYGSKNQQQKRGLSGRKSI